MLVPLLLTSCADIFDMGFLDEITPADQYNKHFEGISPVRGEIRVETVGLSNLNLEYTEREQSPAYEKDNATRIVFANGGSTVYGRGADSAGKDVTVTAAGTYIVSGSADGALLAVSASSDDAVHLVLSDLSLTGKGGTAIEIRSAGAVLLTLEGENSLSNSTEGKPSAMDKLNDAVLLSRMDLCINGSGSLSVFGNRTHGIASMGVLTVTAGKISVSTTKAGLVGERAVRLGGGEIAIRAEEEGVLSGAVLGDTLWSDYENVDKKPVSYVYVSGGSLTVKSTGDSIRAESLFVMKDGVVDLTSGVRVDDPEVEEQPEETMPSFWDIFEIEENAQAASVERAFVVYSDGICAASDIQILGGTLVVDASNHALYSEGTLCVDGGRLYVRAVHEGLCSDAAVGISDGIVILEKSRIGVLAKSVDISGGHLYVGATNSGVKTSGAFRLSGGVCLVAGAKELPLDFGVGVVTGGTMMALGNAKRAREFFPTGKQGVILCYFKEQGEKYPLLLCDNEDRMLLSLESVAAYSCAYISGADVSRGNAYTLMSGGFVAGVDPYGFAMGAESSVASEPLAVVTANS